MYINVWVFNEVLWVLLGNGFGASTPGIWVVFRGVEAVGAKEGYDIRELGLNDVGE